MTACVFLAVLWLVSFQPLAWDLGFTPWLIGRKDYGLQALLNWTVIGVGGLLWSLSGTVGQRVKAVVIFCLLFNAHVYHHGWYHMGKGVLAWILLASFFLQLTDSAGRGLKNAFTWTRLLGAISALILLLSFGLEELEIRYVYFSGDLWKVFFFWSLRALCLSVIVGIIQQFEAFRRSTTMETDVPEATLGD
jgi:hypothetical protein